MSLAAWRKPEQQERLTALLARLVIILGLLNIPVECAVAAGPHSMFLAAERVAGLQQGAPEPESHFHAMHHRAHLVDELLRTGSMNDPLRYAAMAGVHRASRANQPSPGMPTPAGFASDGIPLRAIAGPVAGPRLVGPSPYATTWTQPLREREAAGPEPPPPNLG